MTIKQCVQRDGQQLQQGPVNAWLAGKSGVLNKPTVGTVKTKKKLAFVYTPVHLCSGSELGDFLS